MRIVLIGAGGHAHVISDVIKAGGNSQIVGIVAPHPPRSDHWSVAFPFLGDDRTLVTLGSGSHFDAAIVAIGDNPKRMSIAQHLATVMQNIVFASAVHPAAVVAPGVPIGAGTVVMPGAIVNAGSRVGNHCIVNTQASIDHDNVIEDFASIAPGVVTGGNVRIGRAAVVCIGASVAPDVRIGANAVIGAGAVVLNDIADNVVAYGIPARVVRLRTGIVS